MIVHYRIRDWIRLLEPKVRAKLMTNLTKQQGKNFDRRLDRRVSSLRSAIDTALTWASSHEGRAYWVRQYDKACLDYRTPDALWQGVDCTIPEEEV